MNDARSAKVLLSTEHREDDLTTGGTSYRDRTLTVLAWIAGVAAVRLAYPVLMPAMFALMILAAIWPFKALLDRRLPGWLAYLLTVLVLLALLGGFGATIYLSAGQMVSVVGARWPEIVDGYEALSRWAAGWGFPLDSAADQRRVAGALSGLMAGVYAFTTYLGFIAILVVLGLPEARALWGRITEELDRRSLGEIATVLAESARQVRGYLATTLATSALTGACSALLAFAVGLDLALVWGLLNFVLNFVPVVGNIVGIVPPTLYALLQFGGWRMPLVVFAGFVILQLFISNVVYPLLQGRRLSLSPVAILLAMAFWSWLWGIAGALIAVPLTATAIIICERFDRTRWIATLISR